MLYIDQLKLLDLYSNPTRFRPYRIDMVVPRSFSDQFDLYPINAVFSTAVG